MAKKLETMGVGSNIDWKRPNYQTPPFAYKWGEKVRVRYTYYNEDYNLPAIVTDWIEEDANLESMVSLNVFLSCAKTRKSLGKNGRTLITIPAGVIPISYLCKLSRIKGAEKKINV